MPRKHGPAVAGFEKTLNKFFEQILQAIVRHVDFGVVRCVVLAGPGFTKDQLLEYVWAEAQRKEMRGLLEAKAKFITAHASSGCAKTGRRMQQGEATRCAALKRGSAGLPPALTGGRWLLCADSSTR